ncbi:hypothetical protein [Bacillus pumilus]|uniref:hypothetical protein n=1 Tax=Bacillus pumilus TaxID=1408 RepID=UPI0021B3F69F|nr:hypothetical protein [Bacillus pumilus]
MNENNPIISSVITKLHKQQEKGLKKYGVEVDTSSHDLKGWMKHAQEETLDFATYLEAAIQLLEEQQDDLTVLKQKLENEIQVLNKRIEYREGHCFHDEEKAIERFHSEAFAYERVIKMIDVLKGE